MPHQQFGLIGLAVMGQNLALNIESRGFSVAVYNRTTEKTERFVAERCEGRNIAGARTLEEFVAALERPRKIMLMVKSGQPVDDFIGQLAPRLDQGDLIVDGGNSHFQDTIRRSGELEKRGILYIGTGVSGGEEGALKGPSIMPGGQRQAYEMVEDMLVAASAKVDGEPCCAYIGPDGAGHYVKMVHNGIEYGDMQLICEAYYLMKNALCMTNAEMFDVFSDWNEGDLDSYLIEITRDIMATKDAGTGEPLVERILDKAGQKGTGKWTSQSALDLGVPAPTIAEAVFARCMSAIKDERLVAAKKLRGPKIGFRRDKGKFIDQIRDALHASKVCSYAQGFALMKEASKERRWKLNFAEIATIWRGGCIIRARFLDRIRDAYTKRRKPLNLMLDPYFKRILNRSHRNWRQVVIQATRMGIPVPAFSSALAYYDSYRRERLSANLIQAQRDYFGAHTYERIEEEHEGKAFHTDWVAVAKQRKEGGEAIGKSEQW